MWLTSKNQLTLCKGHYSQYCGWALSNQLKGFMREKLRFLKEEEILPQDCNIKSTQLPWWLSHKESVCQCRRHGFQSVIWDDLTCCRATKPTPQLLRACAVEPKSPNYYSPNSLEPGSTRVCAKQLQSCPILCDPMDCSPPGFSVHGILQARILEWVAISSSRVSSWLRDQIQVYSAPALTGRFFTTSATWEAPPQQEKPPQWEAAAAVVAAKLLQSCPTLCDPIDSNLLGSPVPGILQARTLEWVAISFSNAWKWKWSHLVVSDS